MKVNERPCGDCAKYNYLGDSNYPRLGLCAKRRKKDTRKLVLKNEIQRACQSFQQKKAEEV